MAGGRPTKYDPSFCDTIIELGREGKTKAHMAIDLNVSEDTIYEWLKVHPEFSEAMKRAEAGMAANFHSMFTDMATNSGESAKGNVTAAIFLAKNQLPNVYRDRHEHKVEAEVGVFEISYEGANYGHRSEDEQE